MTSAQQHHIRNGSIAIQRILRWVLTRTELTATQRAHLHDAMAEAARIELHGCGNDTCKEEPKTMSKTTNTSRITGWKTKTGGWLALAAGVAKASANAVPSEEAKPWLDFAATVLGGASLGLLGTGLGHKIEKAKWR